MTYAAFDYADRDRNPVLILADGVIGTMMEPVVLPGMKSEEEVAALKASKQGWACVGHKLDYAHRAWIQPGHWLTSDMQKANEDAAALYASWEKDVQVEEYRLEDAEVVLTAYGHLRPHLQVRGGAAPRPGHQGRSDPPHHRPPLPLRRLRPHRLQQGEGRCWTWRCPSPPSSWTTWRWL